LLIIWILWKVFRLGFLVFHPAQKPCYDIEIVISVIIMVSAMPAATLLACRKEGLLFALQTRSNLCTPRNKTARPRSQFPRFIYSHRSSHFAAAKQVDRSWECTNRSQILECRNWERGRAVSFLGIFFRIFFADGLFAEQSRQHKRGTRKKNL
jgi:hypothetical protein